MPTSSNIYYAPGPAMTLDKGSGNGVISSVAQLEAALSTAKAGDVLKLASGVYSGVRVEYLNFAANVTITSADSKNPAVLTDLLVRGSSNITFTDLTLKQSDVNSQTTFNVRESAKITLDHLKVSGPVTGNLSEQENGLLMIRNTTDVKVTNSEFSNARYGINMLDNTGVQITGNYFHELRTDGVRGGALNNITISGNVFTDFHPKEGDHPDAIQFWTSHETEVARNITITDNLIVRGDGAAMQGIFMRDEVGTLPYENVKISGNIVAGGMINGISVQGLASGEVSNNTVIALDGEKSWIRLDSAEAVTVSNNSSTGYAFNDSPDVNQVNNKSILGALDEGAGAVNKWLAAHPGLASAWGANAAAIMDLLDLKLTASSAIADEDRWTMLKGLDGVDRMTVAALGNTQIEAGAGADFIYGGLVGKHVLMGGDGNDSYFVYSSKDIIIETATGGTDTIVAYIDLTMADNVESLRTGIDSIKALGNAIDNRMVGSAGNDDFRGMGGHDTLLLGAGNDLGYGGEGNDSLSGGLGNDTIYGENGNDQLTGNEGNDRLDGGAGNDVLEGGTGVDVFTGGAGADEFRFRPGDLEQGKVETVTDFTRGEDIISLGLIDANANTTANDKFKFIGTEGFHKVAGELRYVVANGDATVYGDVNGDGSADFAIKLLHIVGLAASDFVL